MGETEDQKKALAEAERARREVLAEEAAANRKRAQQVEDEGRRDKGREQ